MLSFSQPIRQDPRPAPGNRAIGCLLRSALIVLLLAVLLISIAVIFHRNLIRAYAPSVLDAVATQYRDENKLDFAWQGYSIAGLTDFRVSGITITDLTTGLTLATAESLRVRTSLYTLALHGSDPAQAITTVEIVNPVITLGRKDGKWNAESLFKPPTRKRARLPGKFELLITDGVVQWSGGEVSDGFTLQPLEISGLQGTWASNPDGNIGTSLIGTMVGPELEPSTLKINGDYDPGKNLFEIAGTFEGLDLKVADAVAQKYGITKVSGLADTEFSILVGPGTGEDGWSLLGKGTLRNASAHSDRYNIDAIDVAGDLQFSHKSAFSTGLSCKVGGAEITLKGSIGDFVNPSYRLAADWTGATPETVARFFPEASNVPYKGAVNGHAEYSGTPDDFDLLVEADSPAMSAYGVPFALRDVLAWYSDNKLVVQRVEAGLASGEVAGEGSVDFSGKNPTYQFHAAGTGLNAKQIAMLTALDIPSSLLPEGSLSLDIDVTDGDGSPQATGIVQSDSIVIPAMHGLPPASLTFPFSYSRNRIEFGQAVSTAPGIALLAQGSYDFRSGLDASFVMTVDDPSLVASVSGLPISGKLSLSGDVSYADRGKFMLDGEGILSNGFAAGVDVPTLSAHFGYSDGTVRLSDFSGLVAGAEFSGDLTVPVAAAASAATGTFHIRNLDIGPLLPEPVDSIVSTDIYLDGSLAYGLQDGINSVSVNMLLTEHGARIGPNFVTTVDSPIAISVTFPPGFADISEITVEGKVDSRPANAQVYLGRELTPYSERIVEEVTNLLTGRTGQPEPDELIVPVVKGLFSIDANVNAPLGRSTGHIDVIGEDLRFEGYDIAKAGLHLMSTGGNVWEATLSASSDSAGSFDIKGNIDRGPTLAQSAVALIATVRDSGINQLLTVLGLTRFGEFSGSMNGQGNIAGTLASPVVSDFQLSVSQSEAFGIPLNEGSASFGYNPPILSLSSLDLRGDNGFEALGTGSINLMAPSLTSASFGLNIDKLDLDYVAGILGREFPLGGILSGKVQLARDALGVKVLYIASVEQASVKVGEERLALGNISLDAMMRPSSPQVTINSLELTRESQSIRVAGKLPISMLESSIPLIDITVDSDTGYSPPIPAGLLATGVSWDGGFGPTHLSLIGADLNGDLGISMSNLKLGSITLANSIAGAFHCQNSVITASPEDMKVVGDGWEIGVSGQANLPTMRYNVPFSFRFSAVPISEGPLVMTGPGYDIRTTLGSAEQAPSLVVQGAYPHLTAVIAGTVNVEGGSIDTGRIPPIPVSSEAEGPDVLAFNMEMKLDGGLSVNRGDFYSFDFNQGSLSLTGPATQPLLSGTLIAPQGWLDIMGNHFTLIEPLEMSFSSLYRFDPRIIAAAQATLREVRSPENYGEQVVVTARIDALMSKPLENMQLSSEPPMSQDQLIAALAYEDIVFRTLGGSVLGESFGAPGLQDLGFEGIVLPLASSYLSRYIRRETGLSDFEVSVDPQQRLYVYIEKDVFENLVMYYQQTFGPDTDSYLFGTRYRWRPRSWVGLEFNENEDLKAQVQYIIPLD
jgi:hypothetical protein